jgi:hypothetical protein
MASSSQSSRTTAGAMIFIVVVFMSIALTLTLQKSLQPATISEQFTVSTPLPMAMYNTQQKDMNCERNVAFTYQAGSKKTVYERALNVESDAVCSANLAVENPSVDLIEVKEGEIAYDLKMKCIGLRMKNIQITSPNKDNFTITVDSTNIDFLKNMILMNPTFLEFNGSTAYIPLYNSPASRVQTNTFDDYKGAFVITNWQNGTILRDFSSDVKLAFRRLTSSTNNGLQYSMKTTPIDVSRIIFPATMSVNAYFMDIQDASSSTLTLDYNATAQTIASSKKLVFNGNEALARINEIKVYDRNYFTNFRTSERNFFYNQKISILLANKIMPVFTFKFNLNMEKNKLTRNGQAAFTPNGTQYEIMRLYMNSSYGSYSTPMSVFKPLDLSSRLNMATISIASPSTEYDSFLLTVAYPTNASQSPQTLDINSSLIVELPYLTDGATFSVTLTMTPFDKFMYITWKSPDNENQYVYKRGTECSKNNSFANIFTTAGENNDMFLKYDNVFIRYIHDIMLGYRQLQDV